MANRIWRYLSEGYRDWQKDNAKKIISGIIFLIISGSVYFFEVNLPEGLKVNDEFALSRIFPWILETAYWLLIQSTSKIYKLATENPIRFFAWIFGITSLFIFIRLYAAFSELIAMHLMENKSRKILLDDTGLYEFWVNACTHERKDQWDTLSKKILASPQSSINYIGATGWATFGTTDAPLHHAFETFSGTIRVMLLNPESDFLKTRATSVGVNVRSYKTEINRSIGYLKQLKNKGHTVILKLYDSPPNWKMVQTPRTLWLQHYHTDKHVIDCPVYIFYATAEMHGLYHSFSRDYQRIWDLSEIHQL